MLFTHHRETATLAPTLLHPKSRGYVELKSSDPNEHPLIQPNYLNEKEDVKTLVDGMKFAYKMTLTQAFKENGIASFEPGKRNSCNWYLLRREMFIAQLICMPLSVVSSD
jgi:choline dehydrogenase